MYKPDLINYLAETLDVTKEQANRYLDSIIEQITYALATEGEVSLMGFGNFKVKKYATRRGVNPKTREPITIEAGKKIVFKPGKNFKELVNN